MARIILFLLLVHFGVLAFKGDTVQSHSCPLVFVVTNYSIPETKYVVRRFELSEPGNVTLPQSTPNEHEFKKIVNTISEKFTDCISFMSVSLDPRAPGGAERVDWFTYQRCIRRRKLAVTCAVYSDIDELKGKIFRLPLVFNALDLVYVSERRR